MFCAYCFQDVLVNLSGDLSTGGPLGKECYTSPDGKHHTEYLPALKSFAGENVAADETAKTEREEMSVLDNTVITYDDIQAVLNGESRTYEVFSTTRNTVIKDGFASRIEGEQYAADNDYDPFRVAVQQTPGSAGSEEVGQLRQLDSLARDKFRNWREGTQLVRGDGLTGKYLKKEYRTRGLKTGNNPYKFINWDAAVDFITVRYSPVYFNGNPYWLRTMQPLNDQSEF
jgi:hypothetical protein